MSMSGAGFVCSTGCLFRSAVEAVKVLCNAVHQSKVNSELLVGCGGIGAYHGRGACAPKRSGMVHVYSDPWRMRLQR
jgi:hypothetical protein